MTTDAIDVSIVVIAYNEERRIRTSVEALLAQDDPGAFEILVVDDGSTDATAGIVAELSAADPRVRLVALGSNRGRGAARAAGLAAARGVDVGFVDADITVPGDWLRRCRELLRDHDAVSGLPVPDGDVAVIARMFGATPRPAPTSTAINGTNVLFRGGLVRDYGIPTENRLGEDFRLAERLRRDGRRLITDTDIQVAHLEHKSYRRALVWLYEQGVDADSLLVEFRRIRRPDLTWAAWLTVVLVCLCTRPRRLPLVVAAATGAIGVAHGLSKFSARAGRLRLVATLVANIPLMGGYLLGRTVGWVGILQRAVRSATGPGPRDAERR